MEKEGNLFLKTDTTLSISEDGKQIENNIGKRDIY